MLTIIYLLSIIISYLSIRYWFLKNKYLQPSWEDLFIVFIPVINTIFLLLFFIVGFINIMKSINFNKFFNKIENFFKKYFSKKLVCKIFLLKDRL